VSEGIGVPVPDGPLKVPAGTAAPTHRGNNGKLKRSPALSLDAQPKTTIKSRKIAVLAANGVAAAELSAMKRALLAQGAVFELISGALGALTADDGTQLDVDKSFLTAASVFYDAVYVPGGADSVEALGATGDAIHFVNEAFKHCKAIAASGAGVDLLRASSLADLAFAGDDGKEIASAAGVVTARSGASSGKLASAFVAAIAAHRHWDRVGKDSVPA
jgi:catalase